MSWFFTQRPADSQAVRVGSGKKGVPASKKEQPASSGKEGSKTCGKVVEKTTQLRCIDNPDKCYPGLFHRLYPRMTTLF
jgi:hypothetical protein